MKKCRSVDRQKSPVETGGGLLLAFIASFRAPLCEEEAVAETTLGPKCAKHLDEFRAAMADPHAMINVLAGHVPTPEQIEAMIRPLH